MLHLLNTVCFTIFINALCLLIGAVFLDQFNYHVQSLRAWSLRYLAGMMVMVTCLAVLFYAGLLSRTYVIALVVYFTILMSGYLMQHFRALRSYLYQAWQRVKQEQWLQKLYLVIIAGFVGIQIVASLAVSTSVTVLIPLRDLELEMMQPSVMNFVAALGGLLLDASLATTLFLTVALATVGVIGYAKLKPLLPIVVFSLLVALIFLYPKAAINNVLGLMSKEDYLRDQLNCNYDIAEYIEREQLEGNIIDNWSFGYDTRYQYYFPNYRYYALPPDISTGGIASNLRIMAASYLIVSKQARSYYYLSEDPAVHAYFQQRVFQEDLMVESATAIYSVEDCTLYQVHVDQMTT